MKMLLTSCPLLAGCLFSFQAYAQRPAPAVTPAVPPVNAGPVLADSLPLSGKTGTPHVLKIIKDSRPDYHGHLLIKKVPDSYNGHLLVKAPANKNRHLRIIPAPDTIAPRSAVSRDSEDVCKK